MHTPSTEASLGSSLSGRRSTVIVVGALLLIVVAQLVSIILSRQVGEDSQAGSLAAVGSIVTNLIVIWACQRLLGLGFREIGLRRPESWPRTLGLGVMVALVTLAVAWVIQTYVLPALLDNPAPDITRFAGLEGNLVATVSTVLTVWLTSAFPEELIWRGFLMTRLAKLGGGSATAWGLALAITSAHFGLVHFYQGLAGVLTTGVAGFLLGLAFVLFGRNLWLPITAHASLHVISFTSLYMGWV